MPYILLPVIVVDGTSLHECKRRQWHQSVIRTDKKRTKIRITIAKLLEVQLSLKSFDLVVSKALMMNIVFLKHLESKLYSIDEHLMQEAHR